MEVGGPDATWVPAQAGSPAAAPRAEQGVPRHKELSEFPGAQDVAIEQLCPPCAHASAPEGALLSCPELPPPHSYKPPISAAAFCFNSLCYLIQELHLIER